VLAGDILSAIGVLDRENGEMSIAPVRSQRQKLRFNLLTDLQIPC